MRYVLLLRGINVGGKNRVVMAELREKLEALGFTEVTSYINSGNLFFNSEEDINSIREKVQTHLKESYDFDLLSIIISAEAYKADYLNLPAWWNEEFARRDVLFYTEAVDRDAFKEEVASMSLGNEEIHFGELAVYWGKYDEANYKKTAYARYLVKSPCYKQMTVRNGKTYEKIYQKRMEN